MQIPIINIITDNIGLGLSTTNVDVQCRHIITLKYHLTRGRSTQ